jgi:hypothetical protein
MIVRYKCGHTIPLRTPKTKIALHIKKTIENSICNKCNPVTNLDQLLAKAKERLESMTGDEIRETFIKAGYKPNGSF